MTNGRRALDVKLAVPEGVAPEIAKIYVETAMAELQQLMPLLTPDQAFDAAQKSLLSWPATKQVISAIQNKTAVKAVLILGREKQVILASPGDPVEPHQEIGFPAPAELGAQASMEDAMRHFSIWAFLTSTTVRTLLFAQGYYIRFALQTGEQIDVGQPAGSA